MIVLSIFGKPITEPIPPKMPTTIIRQKIPARYFLMPFSLFSI
jgi:hypothetical protein